MQEANEKEARKTEITIGSLFDGIGGFPLAGNRCGIKTLWASEIEPFPIKVTKTRFPDMKHLGDIAKINGSEIEPVDIITFGSPCQDLSVAGKRAGLAGERSGLFMEAVRIIKEMRNTYAGTNEPIRPRFAVWENVPGAFSSNKGEDFRAVLEEICRVKDETVVIPGPPKGKWNTVGAIMGNGYSVAWRILDAQYWGVPQRRRRIFLVADFGGQSAPEILFKRKGLSRYSQESGDKGERVATDAERCAGKTVGADVYNLTLTGDTACTLNATSGSSSTHSGPTILDMTHACDVIRECGQVVPALQHRMGTGGNQVPLTYQKVTSPLMANSHPGSYTGQDAYTDMLVTQTFPEDKAHCLSRQPQLRHRDDMDNLVVTGIDAYNHQTTGDKACTLISSSGSSATHSGPMVSQRYSVRRLTPLECERLQGFPDGWTDIPGQTEATQEELEFWRDVWLTWDKTQAEDPNKVKPRTDKSILKWLKNPVSDSAQYKALGNSVAVPCVEYVLEGIKEVLEVAHEK